MKTKSVRNAVILLMLACLLTGCSAVQEGALPASGEAEEEPAIAVAERQDINGVHLRDKELLYADEDDTGVVTMYLTVSRGNSAENTDHTWEEINTYSAYDYEKMGVARYQVNALLQVGDESGPLPGELGYGESVPNATVQIRGQTSSRNAQKNYKVELKKNKGLWNGQRTINLNKHQTEGMRFRNKLAYELLQGIPQLMSLRTQFVHLYVKDMTGGEDAEFEDYGLYTQVEQLNKTALRAHGLDVNGHLYKINFFEFFRYEDVILMEDDPNFDKAAFEELLEIKGDSDHSRLIAMLEALNDYTIPIDEVLDTYFDRENLMYWLSFQILIGNVDTQSRNVYLYSPQNSDTWYLIPWDHDGAFFNTEYEITGFAGKGGWESGISNYWGNVLFQRSLKSENFRRELDTVMLEMRQYLSKERVGELAERYAEVVKPYAYSMPDAMYEPLTEEEYDEVLKAIPGEIEENYQIYLDSLEKPMPFYIGVPEASGQTLKLHWDTAYDLNAEDIEYTVELAKDYMFDEVIYSKEGLLFPEIETELPPPGQYFVRVRATNASGRTQYAFDYYVTDDGKNFGMKCFYVNADGTISEDLYEE